MEYIFNADDFGRTETVNRAITEGFKLGYLDRTTIMVNMPFFEEAVKLSEKYGFKDKVGLHINLTSGMPLTDDVKRCPRICNQENGYFNSYIFRDRKMQFFMTRVEKDAIGKEIDAQIEKYLANGFTLLHADSHGHIHTFPAVLNSVLKELKKNDFHSLRIAINLSGAFVKKIYKFFLNNKINLFNYKHNTKYDYFEACGKVIENASDFNEKKGNCEVMLHPNFYDGEIGLEDGYCYKDLDRVRK